MIQEMEHLYYVDRLSVLGLAKSLSCLLSFLFVTFVHYYTLLYLPTKKKFVISNCNRNFRTVLVSL